MCDASTAVSIIQRYVDEHLFSPSFTWPKYEFRKRSYQQWAAYEICDRIMDKPFDDPITVIENFMFEMAMYACYGEDEQRTADIAAPILRETVSRVVDGKVVTMYKDELEKILYKDLYSHLGLQIGG